jgi:co-chaperonin GroES (HSP10)
MNKLRATFANVVLKLLPKTTHKGSIVLPDASAEDSDWCEVVSVGPQVTEFKVGEHVLRPMPEYEHHDEETDEMYLIVVETGIVARRVEYHD